MMDRPRFLAAVWMTLVKAAKVSAPRSFESTKKSGAVLEVVAKSGGPAEDIRFETSPSSVKPYAF
jgi:hypothetical protein